MIRAALACLLLPLSEQTLSQAGAPATDSYPNRPIRIIVTVPPGGAADFIARTAGAKLAESVGQQVLIENRAGAGGTIAADAVAKAPADGYMLLQASITTHGIGPHLYAKLPYDPVKDFAPITMLATLPLIMVVNAGVPAASAPEFIALARASPGQFSFASSGNGGAPHMAGELFKGVTGVDMLHVPYKGSGPAVADLVASQVQVMFDAAPALIAHVRSGKLRALAAASPQRNRLAPEVPTFGELGFPRIAVSLWYGMLAPAATPRPIVDRLNREFQKILDAPDVRERLISQGADPAPGTPVAFAAFIRDEMAKWGPVVKQAGVKLD